MIWGRRYPGQNDFGSFFQLRREKIAGIERCWKEKLALFFLFFWRYHLDEGRIFEGFLSGGRF